MDFINRVRTLQDLPELPWVQVAGTERDHEAECILGRALDVPIVISDEDHYMMLFADRLLARRVGVVTGLPWQPDPPCVRLPKPLVDLCVAEHLGFVECDDLGLLTAWWVPQGPDDTDLWPLTPKESLFHDEPWIHPRARRRGHGI